MSQYLPALNYTLDWEDPKRLYAVVPDTGGYAISGINSAAWPVEFKAISSAPQKERSNMVFDFYRFNFWNVMKVGGINFQDLANRVLDEGVNASSEVGIKLLQRATLAVGSKLDVDGVMGPETLEVVNGLDPERLLAWYRQTRLNYYIDITTEHPQFERYLPEWEIRAKA